MCSEPSQYEQPYPHQSNNIPYQHDDNIAVEHLISRTTTPVNVLKHYGIPYKREVSLDESCIVNKALSSIFKTFADGPRCLLVTGFAAALHKDIFKNT